MAIKTKALLVVSLLLLVANCMQYCVNGEPQVACFFIFGDSLSDNGNNNNLQTAAKANYNPYGIDLPEGATGRFTNGRTQVDFIAQYLGYAKPMPPYANTRGSDIFQGVNYASGAAGILYESGKRLGDNIYLGKQLNNHRLIYLEIDERLGGFDRAKQYLNKCLYYVNIGSNDYINNFFLPESYLSSRIYTLDQYTTILIDKLSEYIKELHNMGGRRFVLVGVGLIGCTPNAISTRGKDGMCVDEFDAAAFLFNEKLYALVQTFNNKFTDSKFIFINSTEGTIDGSLGFTVLNAACCPTRDDGQCYVHGVSQVPCLFIFGDSLSDSGNNNELPTTSKSNYRPYGVDFPFGPTGRFTNGQTTIDIITQLLGFENFIPPFANTSGSDILKGVNYASGGAGIRNETGSHLGGSISLGMQFANHKVIVSEIATRLGSPDLVQQYLEKCLYYVDIGSNDYMGNYFLPQFYPSSSMYSPEQYTQALIEELSLHVQALHEVGARKYVLAGLGLIGCTPGIMDSYGTNGSCLEEQNVAAFNFNNKLKALVDQFNNGFSADSQFIFIDTQALAIDLCDKHEFLVPAAPCCQPGLSGECIPDQMPCNNRNDYVFWDAFHTTEAWNLLNAITYYNSTTGSAYTYPMDIKHLVDYEITKMELELTNDSTSQPSATE
ncbi:unnamed protein product [Sphenostylis stenocarpa]|uniref:Triacylglycerol lipase n=1 Tax=Sphenostylis stenocarpa TaxID=92480 RepID=A0AA86VZ90_9FABA|nr:unnamed protein product [Sphenostylis stenocarpa]